MGITGELNKESPMYSYTVYTKFSWSMLVRRSSHWGGSLQNGLVEQPWLQLMCCAVCLPHGRNFR